MSVFCWLSSPAAGHGDLRLLTATMTSVLSMPGLSRHILDWTLSRT